MDEINLKVNSSDVIQLFNGLLALPRSIFRKENEEREKLIKYLWTLVDDRNKWESLWNKDFRKNVLEEWNIPYKDDLFRLDVPEILEDD